MYRKKTYRNSIEISCLTNVCPFPFGTIIQLDCIESPCSKSLKPPGCSIEFDHLRFKLNVFVEPKINQSINQLTLKTTNLSYNKRARISSGLALIIITDPNRISREEK
ncbi:hypothetical protein DERP_012644 [Dermatophagoides pteronyssinus]|uniref:Uncharacterized protein n=1 Tax=Dermatophagoides pteronyssinus TaxID=6956 RepID=A0ABQ8IYG1_DERPT|nr:hypothetical protein DERP_012644 [Dermatophagoides pteronyssinus]